VEETISSSLANNVPMLTEMLNFVKKSERGKTLHGRVVAFCSQARHRGKNFTDALFVVVQI
jgi:hypothetical protein